MEEPQVEAAVRRFLASHSFMACVDPQRSFQTSIAARLLPIATSLG
jgi:hypothetical protein